MDQSRPIIPRVGRTDYLNTKPVFYGFDKGVVEETFTTTRGEPSSLNRLLVEGELDISLISSAAYAFDSEKYLILPDLSISSFGPVDSVLLLSKVPIEKLDGKLIVLTESSATSIQLIPLLLTELYSVSPVYTTKKLHPDTVSNNGCHAVLAIGDEALRLRQQSVFPYVLDLGEAWRQLTGLPFVFAVWAVRNDFYAAHPKACQKIHSAMLSSKAYGLAHLAEISAEAHNNAHLTVEECREYFNHLKYDLDGPYQKGLQCFFGYLYRMKVVPNPVKIRFID